MDDSPVNPVIDPAKAQELLDRLGLAPEAKGTTEPNLDSVVAEVEPVLEAADTSAESETVSETTPEPDTETTGDGSELNATFKSLYYGSVLAKWELEKPKLIEKIAKWKASLDAGEDAAEVRKAVLLAVQQAKLPHNYVVFDDKFNIRRQNNGTATDRIMSCLRDGEDTEKVLRCVFGYVYGILESEAEAKNNPPVADTPEPAQDDASDTANETTSQTGDEPADDVDSGIGSLFGDIPAPPPVDTDVPTSLFGSDVRVDAQSTDDVTDVSTDRSNSDGTSTTVENPPVVTSPELSSDDSLPQGDDETEAALDDQATDSVDTLSSYINHLAADFSNKVDEIEVDEVMVFVPSAYTVTLRKAQSDSARWLLSYDSIFGAQFNRYTGFGEEARQIRFSQLVSDQEAAQHADASDLQVIAELIRNSVPRKDNRPLSYALMTSAKSVRRSSQDDVSNDGSRETLLDDLARLVGLEPGNDRRKVHNDVYFLLKELLRGKNADELKQLYAEKVESIRLTNERREAARRQAEEKAKALAKLPPPPVPAVTAPSEDSLAERQRNIDAVRAFIQVQIRDCQTREEALAIRSEIVEKAKALLK